ncbi:hypothetical protein Nmel_008066, partial [Mimus melanotis]
AGRAHGGTGARRDGRTAGSGASRWQLLPGGGKEVVTAPLHPLQLLLPLLPLRKSMCAEFGGRIFKVYGQSVANTSEEGVTG